MIHYATKYLEDLYNSGLLSRYESNRLVSTFLDCGTEYDVINLARFYYTIIN